MQWIYLDSNATSQPAPEVVAAMREMLDEHWGNPSSVYRFGQAARQRMELARASVAKLINCKDRELIFTSGGTEANNLAIGGTVGQEIASRKSQAGETATPVIISTPIEHPAVSEPAELLERHGARVVTLPVDIDGRVAPDDLLAALDEHVINTGLALVTLQWANNETGVMQPMAALAAAVTEFRQANPDRRVLLHSDATQMIGKVAVDVKAAGLDLMTMAAHKFHGPKGAGALYVRRGVRLATQQRGGPQERQRRGGTENTAGLVGMGMAAELAQAFLADQPRVDKQRGLRDRFEHEILTACPGTVVNSGQGADSERLWNTSNLGFPRLEAEAILLALSERGVCASAGAACSSGSLEASPVLVAMGVEEKVAHGSVRFSISRYTTDGEIDQALEVVPQVIARLSKTLPVPG